MIIATQYCKTHPKQVLDYILFGVRYDKDHSTWINLPYCKDCHTIEITKKELNKWFGGIR